MTEFSTNEFDDGLLDEASGIERTSKALAASGGRAMQKVGGQYATAISVPHPRNLQQKQKQLIAEARLAGEGFYYGWGAGKSRVLGPSIGLAMAAARVWGNCAVEPMAIQETDEAWIMGCTFVDLETGFNLGRQFRMSKSWSVEGRYDEERKDDMRFQIGQSKAARNVIINALPKWMIDAALDAAQEGARERIEKYIEKNGMAAAVDLTIRELAKYGVTEEMILQKMEVAAKTGLTVDHVVMLAGDMYALKNGQDRVESLYQSAQVAAGSGGRKVSSADAALADAPKAEDERRRIQTEREKVAAELQKTAAKAAAKTKGGTKQATPTTPPTTTTPQTPATTATTPPTTTPTTPTPEYLPTEAEAEQFRQDATGGAVETVDETTVGSETVEPEAEQQEAQEGEQQADELPAGYLDFLAVCKSPAQVEQALGRFRDVAESEAVYDLMVWEAEKRKQEIRGATRQLPVRGK